MGPVLGTKVALRYGSTVVDEPEHAGSRWLGTYGADDRYVSISDIRFRRRTVDLRRVCMQQARRTDNLRVARIWCM